ncbi:hypothetical protein SNE40_022877 [Patella caerulea]|uniref:Uncharacterized protein n=1 Tax=Patella caerulea TaxID=87958 RepID=A0AAN8G1M7_PATCE
MDSTSKTDGIQTRSMAKQTDNVGQQVDPLNNEGQTRNLPAKSTNDATLQSSEGPVIVSPKINQGVENNSNQSNKAQAAAVNLDKQSISSRKSKNSSTKGLEALSNLAKIKAKYEFDKKIKELELKRKLEEAEYNKQKIICESQLELLRGELELAIAEASASVYSEHNSIIDNESLIQVHDDDNRHSNTQNWVDNLPETNNDGIAQPQVTSDEHPQLSQNLTGLDPMSKPFVPVFNSANLVPVQQLSQQDINERLVASLSKRLSGTQLIIFHEVYGFKYATAYKNQMGT